jgi:hypothetical protein
VGEADREGMFNPKEYHPNWKKKVRVELLERSRNSKGQEQCECMGECSLPIPVRFGPTHMRHPHRGRCKEINHTWAKHRRSRGKVKIRLTLAHLCHSKKCIQRPHLRLMCEPCHQIYDSRCRQQRRLRGGRAVRWALTATKRPGSN